MPLPVLNARHGASREDLIRFYHRVQLHWVRHVSEETALDCGVALVNAQVGTVWENCVMDAVLPEGMKPADAIAEARGHFGEAGVARWMWVMAPTADVERRQAMEQALRESGHARRTFDIYYQAQRPDAVREVQGLTIIPARASFRHYRELAEESAREQGLPERAAEAAMMHLDDAHVDALVAIEGSRAVAMTAVLAVGEIGGIQELFVTKPRRGQGIGRTMFSRAMEICARSLFRHVFIASPGGDAQGKKMYERLGFQKIGEFAFYWPAE